MKNAQEAHEAIRPAGESFRTPGQVARSINGDEFRLYELIWQRTIASQMVDARGLTLSLRITASRRRPGMRLQRLRAGPSRSPASCAPTSRPWTRRRAARPMTPSAGCRT